MPIKPNNTDKLKNKPGEEDANPLEGLADIERDKGATRYGRNQELKFDPDADTTQPQEYKDNRNGSISKTNRYTVDKTGQKDDEAV